jgi:guanylate kinase
VIPDETLPGLLFVLVGPGGAGKNTVMKAALTELDSLRQLATATTRAPRPEEQHGQQHLFINSDHFKTLIAEQELIEWQEVTADRYYGVPRSPVERALRAGEDLIADIDVFGATSLRLLYPDNVILIFIQPPSIEVLEARMRERNAESKEVIAERIKRAKMEMRYIPLCDYVITNDKIDSAQHTLKTIVALERAFRTLRLQGVTNKLPRSRFVYNIAVAIVHGDHLLYRAQPPHLATVALHPAELPYEGAFRLLGELLPSPPARENLLSDITMHGSFIPPATLTSSDETLCRQITFHYIYQLNESMPAPVGWSWIASNQVALPEETRQILTIAAERTAETQESAILSDR